MYHTVWTCNECMYQVLSKGEEVLWLFCNGYTYNARKVAGEAGHRVLGGKGCPQAHDVVQTTCSQHLQLMTVCKTAHTLRKVA